MLARFPPSYKDFSCFLAMRAGGPESARRRLSLIPSLVLRGRGLKDSHTVLPDQPSLELGSRPLHTVRGPWVDGEPVGKTAAVPSPAGHGLSVLSGEATCPERPWAGRGQRAGWCHPGTHRLKDRVGFPGLGVPCSLEGSHCLSLSVEVAGGCPWA